MLWLNGIFWFAVLPIIGLANLDTTPGSGFSWPMGLLIVALVGGVYTQGKLHAWMSPTLKYERRHVGWDDPGSGGGPAGWGGG